MPGSLFVISAASGTGKTSLVTAMRRDHPTLAVSVSHTTRAPRPGERDGHDYHFVSAAAFAAAVAAGDFLEHAEVFGHHYGTTRASVTDLLAADRDVLLEIDWQGAAQIRRLYPQAVTIFILPPTLAALAERLGARAQDSAEVIAARLQQARADMGHGKDFDYLVVNDDFDQALADLRVITAAARLRTPQQSQRHSALLRDLLSSDL